MAQQTKQKRLSKVLASTAHHEAGHAVISWAKGIPIQHVTICPNLMTLGRVRHPDSVWRSLRQDHSSLRARQRIEDMAVMCLAGPAAERKFNPRGYRHYGGAEDRQRAEGMVTYLMCNGAEFQAYMNLIDVRARTLVEMNWRAVSAVAEALLERETLTNDAVGEIYRAAMRVGG